MDIAQYNVWLDTLPEIVVLKNMIFDHKKMKIGIVVAALSAVENVVNKYFHKGDEPEYRIDELVGNTTGTKQRKIPVPITSLPRGITFHQLIMGRQPDKKGNGDAIEGIFPKCGLDLKSFDFGSSTTFGQFAAVARYIFEKRSHSDSMMQVLMVIKSSRKLSREFMESVGITSDKPYWWWRPLMACLSKMARNSESGEAEQKLGDYLDRLIAAYTDAGVKLSDPVSHNFLQGTTIALSG